MSEPELPNLKKKEKERKKAGAAWNWGSGAGEFTGATGGAGAASSAASGAAAQAFSSTMGRTLFGQLLARLMASLGGQLLLAGFVSLVLGGAAVLGYKLLYGPPAARAGAPDLAGISSSIRSHRPGASASLEDLARAARGELKFDPDEPAKTPAAPAEKAPVAETTEPAKTSEDALANENSWRDERLSHNLSGAKLSSSLGGEFGGKNVFNNTDAPKFGQSFDRNKLAQLGAKGKLSKIKGNVRSRGVARARTLRGLSNRTMSHLKMTSALGTKAQAPGVGSESAQTLTSLPFDGATTSGGEPPAAPIGMPDTNPVVNPPSGPATITPPDPKYNPLTSPIEPDLARIRDMAKQAGQLKAMGMMLMILGMMLMAIGAMLLKPPTTAIGVALLAAGAMLLGMGIMMLMMAQMLAQQAKQMGDQLQKQYGQLDTNQAIHECTEQELNTPGQSCDKSKEVDPGNTAGEAAKRTSAEADNYKIIDGPINSEMAPPKK